MQTLPATDVFSRSEQLEYSLGLRNTPMIPIQTNRYSQGYRQNGNEKWCHFSFQWTFGCMSTARDCCKLGLLLYKWKCLCLRNDHHHFSRVWSDAATCTLHLPSSSRMDSWGWIQLVAITLLFFEFLWQGGWLPKSHYEEAHASFLHYQQEYWVFIPVFFFSIREYNWTLVLSTYVCS